MAITEKDILERLVKLRALRKEHGVRQVTLVPDIALLALLEDVADAVESSVELLKSAKPWRAYPMAKVALRASQRLLVISTDADYSRIGVRTWISGRLRLAGDLSDADHKTLEAWIRLAPQYGEYIKQQVVELRGQPWRTETFMWDKPAQDVMNAFLALGREQHASIALPPTGLKADSEGMVTVVDRQRTAAEATTLVHTALDIAMRDASEAVKKRITLIKEEKSQKLAAVAAEVAAKRAAAGLPDYKDDLGLFLMKQSVGQTETAFPEIHLQTLTDTTDDSATVVAQVTRDKAEHSATFFFKGEMREQLLNMIDRKYPDLPMTRVDGFLKIEFPAPVPVSVSAILGELPESDGGSLIPLLVTKVE